MHGVSARIYPATQLHKLKSAISYSSHILSDASFKRALRLVLLLSHNEQHSTPTARRIGIAEVDLRPRWNV